MLFAEVAKVGYIIDSMQLFFRNRVDVRCTFKNVLLFTNIIFRRFIVWQFVDTVICLRHSTLLTQFKMCYNEMTRLKKTSHT